MANDLTVLVADPPRIATLRDELHLPNRVLRFSSSSLPSVFESIRVHQPGAIVLDARFVDRPEGQAFVERIAQLALPDSVIQLVALSGGMWKLTPLHAAPAIGIATSPNALNTRRTPRFPVIDRLQAFVNGHLTNLVDMSLLGAQVVLAPRLAPNQRIRIALPDGAHELRLGAQVAWSTFERPTVTTTPYYRAGMEFSDTVAQALEDYCARYRADMRRPQQNS